MIVINNFQVSYNFISSSIPGIYGENCMPIKISHSKIYNSVPVDIVDKNYLINMIINQQV